MKHIITLSLAVVLAATASAQGEIWTTSNVTGEIFAQDTTGNLVLSTVTPLGTLAQPTGITVGPTGETYIAFSGLTTLNSGVYHINQQGSVNTFYPIGTNVYGLAFDATGDLWATDNGAPAIYELTQSGTVQSTIAIPNPAGHIAISGFNEVFVDVTSTGIVQMTTSGTVMRTITAPQGATNLMGLAVDRDGDCWAAYNSGTVVKINRSTGNFDVTLTNLPAPTGVATNNFDEVYIANNNASGTVFYCTSSGFVNTSVNLGAPAYGISLDLNGDVWCPTNATPIVSNKLDRWTLSPLTSNTLAGSNANVQIGDATGYIQMNILVPNGDADMDNTANRAELDAGSNPINNNSTPSQPQPIVNGLAQPGQSFTISCRQYADATLGFAVAGSQGNNPGNYIPVPGTQWSIPLNYDPFWEFVNNNFWHFQNIDGYLDANGEAIARVNVPNSVSLVGQDFYFAFITLDNNQAQPVTTVSNNVQVTVQP